jgi:hypothetical protein
VELPGIGGAIGPRIGGTGSGSFNDAAIPHAKNVGLLSTLD